MLARIAFCAVLAGVGSVMAQPIRPDCPKSKPVAIEIVPGGYTWNGDPVSSDGSLNLRFRLLSERNRCASAYLRLNKGETFQQVEHVAAMMQKNHIFAGLVGNERRD